jgi:hypothetical protein
MECFDYQRDRMGIGRGLVTIGDTRFGTIYWSGESILRGLPAFRVIIQDEVLQIHIPVSAEESVHIQIADSTKKGLEDSTEALQLELDLTKLLEVIGPFAKSIKCLESAHSTAADVYLFWLAIVAQLEQLFLKKQTGSLPNYVKEQIRAITNRRFNGMINNAPTDIYIAAFFLDPRVLALPIYVNLICIMLTFLQITEELQSFATTKSTH